MQLLKSILCLAPMLIGPGAALSTVHATVPGAASQPMVAAPEAPAHAAHDHGTEEASAQLGRKVAPTIYSPRELARRVKQDNAFVTRVLEQPKLWLIGDESALAA